MLNSEIIEDIENISRQDYISSEDMRRLSADIERLKTEENDKQIAEMLDLFPALKKYIAEHNADNLHKLCTEIYEFCVSVYASTKNDEERKVYKRMIDKLSK